MSNPETVHRRIRSNHTCTAFCLWTYLWKTLATSTTQRGRDPKNAWLLYGLCIVKSRTLHTHHSRSEHISCIVVYGFSTLKVYMRNYVIKCVYRLTIKKTIHNPTFAKRRLGVVA